MLLTLKKDTLLSVLQNYIQIVKPNIIKGFENILCTYNKESQELIFLGGDGTVIIRTSYPEKLDLVSDFSFAVPGQLFISMISSLSKQDISINIQDNEMLITDGKSKFKLNIVVGSEYPINDLVVSGESWFEISGKLVKKLMQPVNFCLDSHKVRPALAGIMLNIFSDKVKSVGSDAKEMMEVTIPVSIPRLDGQDNVKVILPANSVRILQKIIEDDDEQVVFYITPSFATIGYKNILFETLLINSVYPEYESKISFDSVDVEVTANKSEIKSLINRALICMERNDMPKTLCRFENNTLNFSGGDAKSHFEETIPTNGYSGDERSLLLNIRRVKDILNVIETDDVSIKIGKELSRDPLFFVNTSPSEGYSFWTFIMPLRNVD